MVGDTRDREAEEESLSDDEINVILADYPDSLIQAGIVACKRLMALIRHKVDQSTANVNSSQSQKMRGLEDTLKELVAERGETSSMVGYSTGTSISRAEDIAADTDYEPPAFEIGMDDKVGTY